MKLIDMTVTDFASEVDSNSPAPGGGSVSALASDIGVGLARMMAHLSFGKKKFEALDDKTKEEFKVRFDKLGEIRTELSTLVDKDTESFNEFMKVLKLPKETDETPPPPKRMFRTIPPPWLIQPIPPQSVLPHSPVRWRRCQGKKGR